MEIIYLFVYGMIATLGVAYCVGVQVGKKQPALRYWTVFDPEAPDINQITVQARTPDEALGKGAREVFGLDVEEAE